MTTSRWPAGPVEIVPLLDAEGPFTLCSRTEAFPGAAASDWAAARRLDPGAFAEDGGWHLAFRCFLIRTAGGECLLVDTGVGPTDSLASAWAPAPGGLPDALADAGVTADDVDVVVQTHLHSDHVGWSVSPDRAPRFPRARYVVQHDEITALEQAGSPLLSSVIAPLRAADQLHEIDGEVTLTRGPARIVAVPTPGHTPGHQSVLVEAGDRQVIVTGDVLVHAVQLADPDLPYAYEADPALARETRRALLAGGRDAGAVLATAHLTRPFTPIPDPMTD